jgi:hypothetical protein
MKRIFNILVTALLISSAGLQSCSKEKQEEIAYNLATSYLNHGKWQVTKFVDDEKDETDHFNGYVFQFNSDGTVTATRGSNVIKGKWSTTSDGSKTKLNLDFGASAFEELNSDWIIKSGSTSSIQLEHVSGGNGSIDYLNFTKI